MSPVPGDTAGPRRTWLDFPLGPNVAKPRWSSVSVSVSVSAQNTAPARVDPVDCGRGAQP